MEMSFLRRVAGLSQRKPAEVVQDPTGINCGRGVPGMS